ncbi:GNAT family N-acetyltransferase [Paenibacillus phoenicis]|uniref:GNAT family N-acetyltransferase n=1 Tax=Paenibacillus phoenicis TaxID=554117 RepID=A0ABU5PGY0_9BACL|nr:MULTISPECIES: GNAT family N-acetyltransferase [Paenibacillus]EES74939.1 toxin-antitoxin system, toxin component, GNAT family [Paenibacillus sp. oral taxon 786 str. D14]MCT2196466.1 GNAT family N-acetyltransferase [Paenibacillus sp. p3-SID1389]MEA3569151.1 GNAT family N-acetyltransferase [Paenibacillus phoenicis]
MNLRILEESDASIYQSLRLQGLQVNPEAFGSTFEREADFTMDMVTERIKPTEDRFVLGAFDEHGTLAGIVTFIRESSPKTRHKGNVFGLLVTPGMRGKGIGQALMEELLARAKRMEGLEQLNLTVVSTNDSARRLYESLGFQRYGTERRALKWDGAYFDEDYMALRLE